MTPAVRDRDKLFYRIGEVAELTGVAAHVLRYWESVFAELKPRKDSGGQRRYTAHDIEMVRKIQHLLHVQGFTMQGAKQALREGRTDSAVVPGDLGAVVDELYAIRDSLLALADASDSKA